MRRFLIAASLCVIAGMTLALAFDPPGQPISIAQPKAVPAQPLLPAQPGQPGPGRATTSAAILRLEEEVESLEAHRDVKKAYVAAAEVAIKRAQISYDRLMQAAKAGPISREEVDLAKLDVEAARAQLDVRAAEMKEVEVKIKYARKRLEDAKAMPVRPKFPKVDPKPVDPVPDKLAVAPEPQPAGVNAAGSSKIAVFNMAAVMRDYKMAKYRVWTLTEKRKSLSKEVVQCRDEFIRLQQENARDAGPDLKERNARRMQELSRKIEDGDRTVNKTLNDEASKIIVEIYDEIKDVADSIAKKHGYQLVLAYPEGVDENDLKSPMLKELKLKPPAAQPFVVAKEIDVTGELLQTLNTRYPAPPIPAGSVSTPVPAGSGGLNAPTPPIRSVPK